MTNPLTPNEQVKAKKKQDAAKSRANAELSIKGTRMFYSIPTDYVFIYSS